MNCYHVQHSAWDYFASCGVWLAEENDANVCAYGHIKHHIYAVESIYDVQDFLCKIILCPMH